MWLRALAAYELPRLVRSDCRTAQGSFHVLTSIIVTVQRTLERWLT